MKKKNRALICPVVVMIILLMFTISCETNDGSLTQGDNTVTDIDGNVYHTVSIGSQVWMVENLKTTKLNDGTVIPNVTNNTAWAGQTTPDYCWYDNNAASKSTYGNLYSWYTVNAGKLCPSGWHVPSDEEWTTLATFLGGESIAGGKLKDIETGLWLTPNTGATNSSGFTALPGGNRGYDGTFSSVGTYGGWWSTADPGQLGIVWGVLNNLNTINRVNNSKQNGFSVRCIRNIQAGNFHQSDF